MKRSILRFLLLFGNENLEGYQFLTKCLEVCGKNLKQKEKRA